MDVVPYDFCVFGDDSVQVPAHLNFGKYILRQLRSFDHEVALEKADTREKMTYREFTQYAVDLSVALSKLGVQKGDVVALGMDKCNEFSAAMVGIICAGAVCNPLDIKVGRSVLKHKLLVSRPKFLICSNLFWNRYSDTLKKIETILTRVTLEDDADWGVSVKQYISKHQNVNTFEPVAVKGQKDTAIILYSSGTTGMPKGVELTHLNCIVNSHPDNFSDKSLKTIFIMGEWYHNYNIFITFKFFSFGRKIVYSGEITPEKIIRYVEDFQIKAIFITPAMLNCLVKIEESNYNIDSLQLIYCRSSPVHIKTVENTKRKFPKVKQLLQGYGMTEAGEPTSESRSIKGLKMGSVGMASPGTILKVVDPTTRQILGPNQIGEICINGSGLMKGYLDMKQSDYFDEQGFFKTGDLGYYDEDRYFFVIDRLKDVIVYEGIKIAPIELENVLLQHPSVLDVGVIGKKVPSLGEAPMAFVVKKPGSNVTKEELVSYVADEVSPHMKLRGGVEFIMTIPRNHRGKILRNRLREMLTEPDENFV